MSQYRKKPVVIDAWPFDGTWESAHDDLLAALKSAQEHLEYCGYGDKWERECAKASGLEDKITAAIAKAEGRT